MDNPILLYMTGRSGSSTIAGIFHLCGAWVGNCMPPNEYNRRGYFENRQIKRLMLETYGKNWTGLPPDPKPGFHKKVKEILEREGYKDGPWMFKTGAFYHKVWNPSHVVKIKRNVPDTLKSYKECGFLNQYSEDEIKFIVDRQNKIMDSLDGFEINAEKVFDRDYSELKIAIEGCGLTFDLNKINNFMDMPYD